MHKAGAPPACCIPIFRMPVRLSDAALLGEAYCGPRVLAAAAALPALPTLPPRLGEGCCMVVPLLLHDLLDLRGGKGRQGRQS